MKTLTIFVDVDDTLIRTSGTKRIPRPDVIEKIRQLKQAGHELFLWSSGGAEYAQEVANQFDIADVFTTFLPKPEIAIDDVAIQDWTHLRQIHPNELLGENI